MLLFFMWNILLVFGVFGLNDVVDVVWYSRFVLIMLYSVMEDCVCVSVE